MKYVDGLSYLDHLKDYVETSISNRQNFKQTSSVQGIQENERSQYGQNCLQIENTRTLNVKLDASDIGYNVINELDPIGNL